MLNDKKVPWVLPIVHDNRFVTDFCKKKNNLFNYLFAKGCSIIENNIVLPSATTSITDQYLGSVEFTKDDIKITICKIDPNKTHVQDMISIRMLKMCPDTVIEPLENIQNLLNILNISRWLGNKKHRTNF